MSFVASPRLERPPQRSEQPIDLPLELALVVDRRSEIRHDAIEDRALQVRPIRRPAVEHEVIDRHRDQVRAPAVSRFPLQCLLDLELNPSPIEGALRAYQ